MPRTTIIHEPTFRQQIAVFNLIRKGREILSKGKITATDAADLGRIADWAEREFALPRGADSGENVNV